MNRKSFLCSLAGLLGIRWKKRILILPDELERPFPDIKGLGYSLHQFDEVQNNLKSSWCRSRAIIKSIYDGKPPYKIEDLREQRRLVAAEIKASEEKLALHL